MIDSGTKHPENRIHLYDPVGLITDNYGSFRPLSNMVRPRRQALSYDHITETCNSSNSGLGIRTYDHANSTGGIRSYDSFEVEGLGLRSLDDSFSIEVNGGMIGSYDNTATNITTTTTTMIDQDRNDGDLSFAVVDAPDEDDQSEDSTPRLWRPSAPTTPKPSHSPLQIPTSTKSVNPSISLPTSPKSFNSSHLHPTSPKSADSYVSHPTSPKPANACRSHPTSPKSVNFAPFNPTKSLNSSPSHTSPIHHHYQTMSPNSRTQAIAKGRKELMDMVKDLPESFYELSLRDLVDQKPEMEMKKEIDVIEEKKSMKESSMAKETKKQKKISSKKVKKSESKKKMVRSRSVDNGKFLLKTSVFPILGSRKSKKSLNATSSFKVAPMPKAETTSTGTVKASEKDWWRRKSCISSESEVSNGLDSHSTGSSRSSTCSSCSNSSNGRRSNKFLPSCCLFNGRMIRGKK